MGNLRSAQKGFEKAGHAAVITDDPAAIAKADAVVLAGVGAFGDCYAGLRSRGFVEPILAA
ncbi:MAG: imidazole glycerol phosphate synthase subunit HisH, partial [Candidatus Hydrogenedentes bacterium]|nr:imidazole glycerol phosphate synthase subunit HisH [Candidatus Hydrogenedentota bacterium]